MVWTTAGKRLLLATVLAAGWLATAATSSPMDTSDPLESRGYASLLVPDNTTITLETNESLRNSGATIDWSLLLNVESLDDDSSVRVVLVPDDPSLGITETTLSVDRPRMFIGSPLPSLAELCKVDLCATRFTIDAIGEVGQVDLFFKATAIVPSGTEFPDDVHFQVNVSD